MGRFEGRVALVTGATQGVGEAVAERLVAEGASGLIVAGRDRRRGTEVSARLASMGAEAVFVPVELGDAQSCEALMTTSDERFGRIDVLVNAAGLSTRGNIVDTTAELWDTLFAVNVRAPFLLMQAAIRVMRREGTPGAIVNVASLASHGSVPFLLAYAASKAALVALTKNVAYSVAWDRIRVNCINPGWMDTPGEDVIQRRFHSDGQDWLEEAEARQPFGQLIKPEEIAALVAFVASDEAGVMTGSIIDYDQAVVGAGPQPVPTRAETPR
jgi:NAD(P)-dependent dehydrogenase (short-subunit alcohol dehydrogenase family)